MANKNLFNSIRVEKNKKNTFDLSHDVKLSLNMGKLVPTLAMPCIPGETFDMSCENLVRFAPMLAPVMHRYDVSSHYFFVPNRILWPGWEDFIKGYGFSGAATPPAHPYLTMGGAVGYTALADYLGIPPWAGVPGGKADQTATVNVNALPFAAYHKIYQEYFMDQNIMAPTGFDQLTDGNNDAQRSALEALFSRAWEHDYFTSALPFAQRGPSVALPVGNFNDVEVYNNIVPAQGVIIDDAASAATLAVNSRVPNATVSSDALFAATSDLINSQTTINDLRRATKLQEWFERMAVGGARYAEQLWAFFNVRNQDARLQRPEYITGIKSPVSISEVLNTSDTIDPNTGTGTPQGAMAGHGISVTQGKYGHYRVMEHGYIMCIMSVMPRTCYQQGIPKHFLKINDFTEHFWPQFANIGEQEVKVNELYGYGPNRNDAFGYTPRYAEYKYENSRVAGEYRTTFNYWHSGRIFEDEPALNEEFINSDPTHRIFAVTDPEEHKLWCHVLHKIRAVRQMPKYGTPSF